MKNGKKRKLISSVIALALIVAVGTITFYAMSNDIDEHDIFFRSDIHCCSSETLHDSIEIVRLYATEHIFGYEEVLDELFNNGNSFVDIHIAVRDNDVVFEFWPEHQSGGIGMRSSCSFLNHRGPFTTIPPDSRAIHSGGGSITWGGVICTIMTTHTATCVPCGTTIRETSSTTFVCRAC